MSHISASPSRSKIQGSKTHDTWSFCFTSLAEDEAAAFAADLAQILQAGDILAFDGEVGMGKSSFARALLRAYAQEPELEVPSPTFTLVQGYDLDGINGPLELSHFDLYRISDFEELYEIGLEESWQTGAALIEWPDRAEEMLPASTLWLHISDGATPDSRQFCLGGSHDWGARLQRLCVKRQLLLKSGWGAGESRPIAGDLSPRSYARIRKDDKCAILMDMPARQPGPLLPDGRLYDLVAHRVTSLAPMVTLSGHLKKAGLTVPAIYGHDLANGLMLWQDFGTETLATSADQPDPERYKATLAALSDFHQSGKDWTAPLEGEGGAYQLSRYDRDAFLVELDVFLDWYWPHCKGADCPKDKREDFIALWREPLEILNNSEQMLVLRDVQDPNCFWLGDQEGRTDQTAIGFIDYQDCLIGPAAYDIAALCMDARINISRDLESELKQTYINLRDYSSHQQERFELAYAICGLQRTSKNLGAFARAAASLGRDDYLAHIPRGLDYLKRCLEHPALGPLQLFYRDHGLLE